MSQVIVVSVAARRRDGSITHRRAWPQTQRRVTEPGEHFWLPHQGPGLAHPGDGEIPRCKLRDKLHPAQDRIWTAAKWFAACAEDAAQQGARQMPDPKSFLPSQDGFAFTNAWPSDPIPRIAW